MLRFLLPLLLLVVACAHRTRPPGTASTVLADGLTQALPPPADVAAPPARGLRTGSGLATVLLRPGSGTVHPDPGDNVLVHYTGWTTDGAMFDSSLVRGKPANFALQGVIAGFREGLQLMVVGEKRRLWIPEELAYQGKVGRPAGMLVFDIELLEVHSAPDAPAFVAEPHPQAEHTTSGLATMVLRPGIGAVHPGPDSKVTVHYTGWDREGEIIDSSVVRGQPATFPLDRVVAGYSEGVQLMVVGEVRRLWIPPHLGYQDMPGRPQGMMIFDVELLDVE
jgi:FKBP-type peptidyl-prolyl cis-trans isomerase